MMDTAHRGWADELVRMADEDHTAAADAHHDDVGRRLAWHALTARHADRLRAVVEEHGWPTVSAVGQEAARAAWLIAQHADRQLDVQRMALAAMEQAVAEGEADRTLLAFLRDRTRVNEGRPQVYGTQIADVRDGEPVPWPCEDPEGLDARRAGAGIPPFAEYVARHAP